MPLDRIKLLKFVANFNIGGTERQVSNLARGLDCSRFDLELGCLHKAGGLLQEFEERWAPAEFRINSFFNHKALLEQFRLRQYIKQSEIQIVHTYGFYANVFAIPPAKMAGASIIVASIRDTCDFLSPMQRWVQKQICRLANCVLANSEAVRQRLLSDGYDRKKIVVIRNGITLSRFTRGVCRTSLRQEFGLPPDAPLVAVLARLDQVKGVEYFIQAAGSIAASLPHARFLIIGDGACRGKLEEYAATLNLRDRLIFTGFRTDVPEMLSDVAVSVLPSLSEGLSNSLLESMAAAVPVIATNVGGNPEVIEEGVTGLLVPPRDPGALAHAVCLLLENRELAARFGQAGKQRVTNLFSVDKMVRETQNLYVSLLESAANDHHSRKGWRR